MQTLPLYNRATFRPSVFLCLRGRDFDGRDTTRSRPVVIVSEKLAKDQFNSTDVVGRHIVVDRTNREIVGVVGNIRHRLSLPVASEVYLPSTQVFWLGGFAIRTTKNMPDLADLLARKVRDINPLLPPPAVQTFAEIRALDAAQNRITAVMLTALAAIAFTLALSGIFGIVLHSVERRTREFGIRIAIGATPKAIFNSILVETFRLGLWAVRWRDG